jgi:hypothetical protein
MGRAGFLLSPFVKDPIDFFSLLSRHPHPPNVTAIAIHVRSNWTIMNAFEPNFQVSFQQLNIPRIPPGTLPTLASPASFH